MKRNPLIGFPERLVRHREIMLPLTLSTDLKQYNVDDVDVYLGKTAGETIRHSGSCSYFNRIHTCSNVREMTKCGG